MNMAKSFPALIFFFYKHTFHINADVVDKIRNSECITVMAMVKNNQNAIDAHCERLHEQ